MNPPGTSTGIASGPSITIDHVPPVVSSANAATASPTPQHTLVWNVVFSEAVTGFDVTDVSFSLNGLAPNGGAVVSGSGTTYTVTQNFNGEGTAQIQINDRAEAHGTASGTMLLATDVNVETEHPQQPSGHDDGEKQGEAERECSSHPAGSAGKDRSCQSPVVS